MAAIYISEYTDLAFLNAQPTAMGREPANAEQTVAIGGSTTQSSAFSNNTNYVRINTDAICSLKFGTNPTAVNTAKRLAANQTEYFAVTPGHKVAVITNS
jgi:hypothetical protein